MGKILVADREGHKTKETSAIPVNQLVDIVKLSSGTLLSRKAKNSRGVSGMHVSTRRSIAKNRLHPSPLKDCFLQTCGIAEADGQMSAIGRIGVVRGNFWLGRGKRTSGSQD